MVNSKHSVKLRSTAKLDLRSSSTNINENPATTTISGINEDENFFKKFVRKNLYKKKDEGESLFDIKRLKINLKFKRTISKKLLALT